jgi:hypothetical protein
VTASIRCCIRIVASGGAGHGRRVPRDEQISWATAEPAAPGLACAAAAGYSVSAWIDGKEKVGGSIPPGGSMQGH